VAIGARAQEAGQLVQVLVLGGHAGQLTHRLQLAQRFGQVQRRVAKGLRHVVKQILDARDAYRGQHCGAISVRVGDKGHQ
jgi:hypothetical protein